MKIQIDASEFRLRLALVRQWRHRASAVRRHIVQLAGEQVYEGVLARIPPSRRGLRRSLRLVEINGLSDQEDAFVVQSVPRGASVPKSEHENTVLYVEATTSRLTPTPEDVKVLEDFSPWTMKTLPFYPDSKHATVLSRKVSQRVVLKIEKDRHKDRRKWSKRLREVGHRKTGRKDRLKVGRRLTAVPDVAFESLRLEFGSAGGGMIRPHWRPAVARLASRKGVGMIARRREFTKAMTILDFKGWYSWTRPYPRRISLNRARSYTPFQKMLGVRVAK